MRRRVDPALVVVLAGVCAALHVGKLPPAIPLLREMLGVSLVQAGFLLSLVQFAGMTLGLAVGLAADGWGLKRSMVLGQCLLALSSAMGGAARSAESLLAWRVVEGLGLLLATMPAPGLIRQLVPPARLSGVLGLWGAYMPGGAAAALLCGPPLMAALGWSVWWWLLSALSLGMAVWLSRVIPPQEQVTPSADLEPQPWRTRLRRTLTARGPWLVALAFAMYSGQWASCLRCMHSRAWLLRWAALSLPWRHLSTSQATLPPAVCCNAVGSLPPCCGSASPRWA
jgi:MFS transporter, CP family, cyanate transporter